MAGKLEALMEQSRREQENLKKSELRTLQAQINPHFLYNTLDAIVWLAESGSTDEVVHITRALSDFFRISLSQGRDWIEVAEELKHLRGYLTIQKVRYRDILDYEIDVPGEAQEGLIVKLLLQPLVENAIYHGIKFRRRGGKVRVVGRREGGSLHFAVIDNGPGMREERLVEVLAGLGADEATAGYGLSNVDRRIRLYYGLKQGLRIHSGSEGTRVEFTLPVRRAGKRCIRYSWSMTRSSSAKIYATVSPGRATAAASSRWWARRRTGKSPCRPCRTSSPTYSSPDIRMPFMDGMQLCEAVSHTMPWVQIVILSGYDDFAYAQQAISLGVKEYLLKPVSAQELLEVLQRIAGRIREQRRQQGGHTAHQGAVCLLVGLPAGEAPQRSAIFCGGGVLLKRKRSWSAPRRWACRWRRRVTW